MIEHPQPPEGDEATTGTMSPLAAVRQYLSPNSAKSMFLHNTGLVVRAISSKLPHDDSCQPLFLFPKRRPLGIGLVSGAQIYHSV